MNRNVVLAVIVVGIAVAGWALFRPEKLWLDDTVHESFDAGTNAAAAETVVLSTGAFHDGAHATSGTATIYQLVDGSRVLRLTGFETSNGPDVQVYLVKAMDATDNDSVKKTDFVNLGTLKGNIGDQNYVVPADVDLAEYRAVTIWCRRFGVNFGTAPLRPASS